VAKKVTQEESDLAERRLALYRKWFVGEGERVAVLQGMRFSDVQPDLLSRVIAVVVAAGDMISFARTRDGGALCVTVMHDKQRVRLYETTIQQLAAHLDELYEDYIAVGEV